MPEETLDGADARIEKCWLFLTSSSLQIFPDVAATPMGDRGAYPVAVSLSALILLLSRNKGYSWGYAGF